MTWDYFPDGKLAARSDDGVPVGLHEVLVDNSDAPNVQFTGSWATADTASDLFGFDYATSAAGTGADQVEWALHIPQDGTYEVFACWPQITGAATDATYTVTHDSGTTSVTVDQTQQTGEWVSLGSFSFPAGDDNAITLSDVANGTVVADAVKLVRDNSSETDTEAKDLTYTYDVNGNLVEILDNSSDASVDAYQVLYDGLNRVAQVEELLSGAVQNTTSFTYNQVGAPLTRTHDDSHAAFAYDVRNLLATVSNGQSASDPDSDDIARVMAIPAKRTDHRVIEFLTDEEVDELLDQPRRGTRTGRRDHVMLHLAIQTGLRASELTGLSCRDVHLGTGPHVSCMGKGRKRRVTPLTAETVNLLRAWITERGGEPGDALFTTNRGTGLSHDARAQRLALYVSRCPRLAGRTITPHVLRHTAAMRLLRAGADITVIALWLGHESVATTQIYLRADLELKQRGLDRTAPPGAQPGRYKPSDRLLAFLEAL